MGEYQYILVLVSSKRLTSLSIRCWFVFCFVQSFKVFIFDERFLGFAFDLNSLSHCVAVFESKSVFCLFVFYVMALEMAMSIALIIEWERGLFFFACYSFYRTVFVCIIFGLDKACNIVAV